MDRRTFLQGAGVALGLPFLECMAGAAQAEAPKRFCGIYFPYGIVDRPADSPHAAWNWFPQGEGRVYRLNKSLTPLEPLRGELSILSGLSHPNGRKMGGHDTADTWLTGAKLEAGHLENSISLDQLLVQQFGEQTRYPCLTISTDGGVGEPTRASTLSFGRNGQPIPAENKPRLIFDRLFGVSPDSAAAQRQKLANSGSMLDLVLEHSHALRGRLGKVDQQKLDEYMASVRQIEQRVERSEQWLDVPKPEVNAAGLHLDADDTTPRELIRTMYDLLYLAFQTDSTRVATYQLGNMNGATSIAGKFPQLLGMADSMHTLAHDARKGDAGAEPLGRWDLFLTEQLAYFLDRLRSTPEGEGSLLDSTVVLYGSSNSQTHVNANYPLVLAGGSGMGLSHGEFRKFSEDQPMANLFVTLLRKFGSSARQFADSTGELAV
ncbi:MAG: DUF1552 domain-containing protein [Bryobacterales bacterium]